jgi:DNA-binding FrmR family transcriptional regulator
MKKENQPKSEKDAVKKIVNRISRIEGQLRGVRKMVEEKKQCIDVITQITAIREAVSMLGIEMLKNDFVCNFEGKNKKKIDEKYLKTLFKMSSRN